MPSPKPWMLVVCLAAFLVASFGFMAAHHLSEAIDVWDGGGSYDFRVWYRTALRIGSDDRTGIYAFDTDSGSATTGFFNPPSMAFLLWPMTLLEYREARTGFLVLSLASVAGMLLVCWRLGPVSYTHLTLPTKA